MKQRCVLMPQMEGPAFHLMLIWDVLITPQDCHLNSPRRSPSYYRRQQKRRETKNVTAPSSSQTMIVEENAVQANSLDSYYVPPQGSAEKAVNSVAVRKPVHEVIKVNDVENIQVNGSCEAEDLNCDQCDFKSVWENALRIHKNKMHSLDGTDDQKAEEEDEFVRKYWSTGKLITCYQTFLDVNKDIEESNIEHYAKAAEKDKALEARKVAFGPNYMHYPPWKKW